MRRRYKKKSGIGVIALVVLVLCGIVAYKKVDLNKQSNEKQQRIEQLEAKIEEEKDRESEIENYKAYMQTKGYIEKIAREKLGLVKPDDILFERQE